jgi:hypothetical protein
MQPVRSNRSRLIAHLCALALTLGFTFVGSGIAVATPATAAVTHATPTAVTPRSATASEVARYVNRDKKAAKELGQFAGGDTLVIGATSALVIVLLVVLIVILLR